MFFKVNEYKDIFTPKVITYLLYTIPTFISYVIQHTIIVKSESKNEQAVFYLSAIGIGGMISHLGFMINDKNAEKSRNMYSKIYSLENKMYNMKNSLSDNQWEMFMVVSTKFKKGLLKKNKYFSALNILDESFFPVNNNPSIISDLESLGIRV